MDPLLYDEFGNYIGPDLDDEDDDDLAALPGLRLSPPRAGVAPHGYGDDDDVPMREASPTRTAVPDAAAMQIVPHEEKEYYPSASEVYGEDVETLVEEEDAQPLSEPIIAPIKTKAFSLLGLGEDTDVPETAYSTEFMLDLAQHPNLVRTVAVVGHLHHGKTAIMDMLIEQTHPHVRWDLVKNNRYTDTHPLERDRGVSIKTGPMSLVLPTLSGKHYLMHLLDTPGHVDFVDEVACALPLCDGAVVVVDAVEGVMANTERILRRLVADDIPFVLVINKVDRLILELRLPPAEAYFKLRHVVEEVNSAVAAACGASREHADRLRVSPDRNNVVFAASEFGFSFTLKSFAQLYADTHPGVDAARLAPRLWGDIVYDPDSRKFQRWVSGTSRPRSFQHFVLEPLYKLFSVTVGESADHIRETLRAVGVPVKASELTLDVAPFLRLVLTRFFGRAVGLVDALVHAIPSAADNAHTWAQRWYRGDRTGPAWDSLVGAKPDGPLVVHVTKLYPRAATAGAGGNASANGGVAFDCLGRVVSGTVRAGQAVQVLGEKYSADDGEDSARATVASAALFQSRYTVPAGARGIGPGNLVLLGGIEASIVKTATVVDPSLVADADEGVGDGIGAMATFAAPRHLTEAVLKIALEPVQPSELPKMLSGLRHINRAYPLAITRVEESGEHVLLGPGELYLDCVMHDLRRLFADIEIKVSDPVTRLAETIVETSALKCFAESPNKRNKLSMIAEPLPGSVVAAMERRELNMDMPARDLAKRLVADHGWDALAARNVWAFGPEDREANVLVNDTLAGEVDKQLLSRIRESVVSGFAWGTREGPLCDEPMRNAKFRLVGADIAPHAMHHSGGQIIPTARRLVHASFLMATPRLMEPVYAVEVQTPADAISAVYAVLARRRGHVLQDLPKPGSPLFTVRALLPAMDAAGFETDLRSHTQGMAFAQTYFDHYQIVPGNPLDSSIVLRPLEPAPAPALARDFMVKTRRRKGLAEDVAITQYFDDPMVLEVARQELARMGVL
ncbi:hypothetical protein H9P43_003505 [Blastocladiella emersonii ATCC 22665]|nr:hypothetical protein H9P43_003505 [Blastocladiella emersonii ATCC 22665]